MFTALLAGAVIPPLSLADAAPESPAVASPSAELAPLLDRSAPLAPLAVAPGFAPPQTLSGGRGEPGLRVDHDDNDEVWVHSFETSWKGTKGTDGSYSFARDGPVVPLSGDGEIALGYPLGEFPDRTYKMDLTIACESLVWKDEGPIYLAGRDGPEVPETGLSGEAAWLRDDAACGIPGQDRQWLATGPNVDPLGELHLDQEALYLAVNQVGTGLFVAKAVPGLTGGVPHFFQVTDLAGGCFRGNIAVDQRNGDIVVADCNGSGTSFQRIYVSTDGGLSFAQRAIPNSDDSVLFPVVAIDDAGTYYVAWTSLNSGRNDVYLASSKDKGVTWNGPVKVNNPSGTGPEGTVFPWITAGEAGKVDLVYYGTQRNIPSSSACPTHSGDTTAPTCNGSVTDLYYVYLAQSLDADTPAPTFTEVKAVADPVMRGRICTQGLSCPTTDTVTQAQDTRQMTDFIQVDHDSDGNALIVYTDGCPGTCATTGGFSQGQGSFFVRQSSGSTIRGEGPQGTPAIALDAPTGTLEAALHQFTGQVNRDSAGGLTADAGGPYSGLLGSPIAIVGSPIGDCTWTSSAPELTTFDDAGACATVVRYSQAGTYTLTLAVVLGQDSDTDLAGVTVTEPSTDPTAIDDADDDGGAQFLEILDASAKIQNGLLTATIHLAGPWPVAPSVSPHGYILDVGGYQFYIYDYVGFVVWDPQAGQYIGDFGGGSSWDSTTGVVSVFVPLDYLDEQSVSAPFSLAVASYLGGIGSAGTTTGEATIVDRAPNEGFTQIASGPAWPTAPSQVRAIAASPATDRPGVGLLPSWPTSSPGSSVDDQGDAGCSHVGLLNTGLPAPLDSIGVDPPCEVTNQPYLDIVRVWVSDETPTTFDISMQLADLSGMPPTTDPFGLAGASVDYGASFCVDNNAQAYTGGTFAGVTDSVCYLLGANPGLAEAGTPDSFAINFVQKNSSHSCGLADTLAAEGNVLDIDNDRITWRILRDALNIKTIGADLAACPAPPASNADRTGAPVDDGTTLTRLSGQTGLKMAVVLVSTTNFLVGDGTDDAPAYAFGQQGQPLEAHAGGAYSGAADAAIPIEATATGGTPPYVSCAWSGTGATFEPANQCQTTVRRATSGPITVRVTDSNDDFDDDTAQVTIVAVGERVEFFLDGGASPVTTASVSTSAASPLESFAVQVDLTGLVGTHTLSADWIDADGQTLGSDEVEFTVGGTNLAPVADAGLDGSANEGLHVILDGTASHDDDSDPLSYAWTQTAGPAVSLDGADTASPAFFAPHVDTATQVSFRLVVSDGQATGSDLVTLTIQNAVVDPPTQVAGLAGQASAASVALTWTAAADGESGVASYRVERASGEGPFALVGSTTTTSYTDGSVADGQDYRYRVIAVDGAGNTGLPSTPISLSVPVASKEAFVQIDAPTDLGDVEGLVTVSGLAGRQVVTADGDINGDGWVVIAFADTGINPYSPDFSVVEGQPTSHPSTYISGFPTSATALNLACTATTGISSACASDFAGVQLNKLYWIPGTKIIGAVSTTSTGADFGPTPILDNHGHGTASASVAAGNVDGTCPRCLVVMAEGFDGASKWAAQQPWIDIVSNSWGRTYGNVGAPNAVVDNVAFGSMPVVAATKAMTEAGGTTLWAAGNGVENGFIVPHTTYTAPFSGVDWHWIVGAAFEESDRSIVGSGKPVLSSSYGSGNIPAACKDTITLTCQHSGTSAATPITAGVVASVLMEAKALLHDETEGPHGDGIAAQGTPVPGNLWLADGKLTRVELWTLVTHTARPLGSGFNEIIPLGAPASPVDFAYAGYGIINRQSRAAALGHLDAGTAADDHPEADLFMQADSVVRQALYGGWDEQKFSETSLGVPTIVQTSQTNLAAGLSPMQVLGQLVGADFDNDAPVAVGTSQATSAGRPAAACDGASDARLRLFLDEASEPLSTLELPSDVHACTSAWSTAVDLSAVATGIHTLRAVYDDGQGTTSEATLTLHVTLTPGSALLHHAVTGTFATPEGPVDDTVFEQGPDPVGPSPSPGSRVVRFTVPEGARTLDLSLSWTADDLEMNDLDLYLFDEAGQPVGGATAATGANPERLHFELPSAETYGLWVSPYLVASEQAYTLAIDITAPSHALDDADADSVDALFDNCPLQTNLAQADADADGFGDACDPNLLRIVPMNALRGDTLSIVKPDSLGNYVFRVDGYDAQGARVPLGSWSASFQAAAYNADDPAGTLTVSGTTTASYAMVRLPASVMRAASSASGNVGWLNFMAQSPDGATMAQAPYSEMANDAFAQGLPEPPGTPTLVVLSPATPVAGGPTVPTQDATMGDSTAPTVPPA